MLSTRATDTDSPFDPALQPEDDGASQSSPRRERVFRALIALADQTVVSGASFATSVMLARSTSTEGTSATELGGYQLAFSVFLILRAFQTELVTAPFTVHQCRFTGERLETFVGSTLFHQFATTLVAILGLVLLVVGTENGLGPERLGRAAWALLLAGPLMLTRDFFRQFSYALMRPGAALFLDTTSAGLQLAMLVGPFLYQSLSTSLVFAAIGSAALVASVAWWIKARPSYRVEFRAALGDWQTNWSFSRWAVSSQLICSCTTYVLPWIVAFMRDLDETGRMSACVTFFGMASMLTTAIGNLLTPLTSRTFIQEGWTALGRVIRNTVVLLLIGHGAFCLFVLLAGEWLLTTIYGASFGGMGVLCVLVAVSNLANSMSVVAGNTLWAIQRPKWNLPADIVITVVSLATSFLLIPTTGSLGAIAGSLVGIVMGAIIRWLFVWWSWKS